MCKYSKMRQIKNDFLIQFKIQKPAKTAIFPNPVRERP